MTATINKITPSRMKLMPTQIKLRLTLAGRSNSSNLFQALVSTCQKISSI